MDLRHPGQQGRGQEGFLLLPDRKWSDSRTTNLWCLALVNDRGLQSIRDLRAHHLPLLRNMKETVLKVMWEQYGLRKSQVRLYFHYRPSYNHLHLHVTHISLTPDPDRCHHLSQVISNLEMTGDYYRHTTLLYKVRERDCLYEAFRAEGHFDR